MDLNCATLQQLSDDRVSDAEELLAASRWSAAYYLAGYAVECALKSCVLMRVERTGIIFEDKRFAQDCWTHNIEELVRKADLEEKRGLAISENSKLGTNWQITKDWSETARYRQSTQAQAEKLFLAITHPADGVIQWVRNHW